MRILITSALGTNGKSIFEFYKGKNTYRSDQYLFNLEKSPTSKEVIAYRKYLKERIADHNIDWLIPCSDHDLNFLSRLSDSDKLFDLNIPPLKTIQNFTNKTISNKIAKNYFNVPLVEKNCDVFVRNNRSDVRPKIFKKIHYSETHNFNHENFCLTKFISGEEFSVDSLYLKNQSLQIAIRKRMQIKDGISQEAEFIENDSLRSLLKKFIIENQIFGYACTQFIRTNNKFYFIECNTRPGGGVGLSFRDKKIT